MLHSRHLIHRDIKPANFVMGDGATSSLVYCIDFGLSKRFRNPHTLQHIPHRKGKSLTGTPRYASISNHRGIEQSRRDDLEAIGYVLIYFVKGRLPWQGLKAKTAHRKYTLILEKKEEISICELCQGCPPQFAEYLSYCRALIFDANPNIAYVRRLFRDLYQQQGYDLATLQANDWDWVPRVGAIPQTVAEPCASSGSHNAEILSRSRTGHPMDATSAAHAQSTPVPTDNIWGPGTDQQRPLSAAAPSRSSSARLAAPPKAAPPEPAPRRGSAPPQAAAAAVPAAKTGGSSRAGSSRYELRRPRTAQPATPADEPAESQRWGSRVAHQSAPQKRPASAHASSHRTDASGSAAHKLYPLRQPKATAAEPSEAPAVAGARSMMAMACRNGASSSTRRRVA